MPQVMLAEDDQAPEGPTNLIGSLMRHEVAPDQLRGNVGEGRGRIDAPAGEGDRLGVEIGGEDADGPLLALLPQQFGPTRMASE